MLKVKSQGKYDAERVPLTLRFPDGLEPDQIVSLLRAISTSPPRGMSRVWGMSTTVFETHSTSAGITHRMLVPADKKAYIVGQLRAHLAGISVIEDDPRTMPIWQAGLHIRVQRPTRPLRADDPKAMAKSLLASVASLADDEAVMLQWIIAPAPQVKLPSRSQAEPSAEFGLIKALTGRLQASADEIDHRRAKLEEQNVLADGRIVARAADAARAGALASRVHQALGGMRTASNRIGAKRMDELTLARVNPAVTPVIFDSMLSLDEAVGVFGWPVGSPSIPGLHRSAARHLYATTDIPSEGRVIGRSNVPGNGRAIAQSYATAVQHTFVVGGNGSGKTVLAANLFAQDVANGYGAIVLDMGGGNEESMFNRALNYIPDERLKDVIIIDAMSGISRPVSYNFLDQGKAGVVVDQIMSLFEVLYGDSRKGVHFTRLMYHSLHTLAEAGGLAFTDVIPLLDPREDEAQWAANIKKVVRDPELRAFWKDWDRLKDKSVDHKTAVSTVHNRAWQLNSRPETRYIVGQSTSSFRMDDVIRENKILLVNLGGIPGDGGKLLSSIILDGMWNSVQRFKPDKPNFLFIDEAQLLKWSMNVADMLARARKANFGVTLATQKIDSLAADVRDQVMTNCLTKIVYSVSGTDAATWSRELGRKYFTESDLQGLARYDAVAKIATDANNSSLPITVTVDGPRPGTGNAYAAVRASAERYGRPLADVQADIESRRRAPDVPKSERPPISDW